MYTCTLFEQLLFIGYFLWLQWTIAQLLFLLFLKLHTPCFHFVLLPTHRMHSGGPTGYIWPVWLSRLADVAPQSHDSLSFFYQRLNGSDLKRICSSSSLTALTECFSTFLAIWCILLINLVSKRREKIIKIKLDPLPSARASPTKPVSRCVYVCDANTDEP